MAKSRAICSPWRGPPPRGNFPAFCTFSRKNIIFGKIEFETLFFKKIGSRIAELPPGYLLWVKKCCFFCNYTPGNQRKSRFWSWKHVISQKNIQKWDPWLLPRGNFSPPTPIPAEKCIFGKIEFEIFFIFLARLATRNELWMTKKHKNHHFFL